jgi:hypothetical protein
MVRMADCWRNNEYQDAFLEKNEQWECSTWNIGLAMQADEIDKARRRKIQVRFELA